MPWTSGAWRRCGLRRSSGCARRCGSPGAWLQYRYPRHRWVGSCGPRSSSEEREQARVLVRLYPAQPSSSAGWSRFAPGGAADQATA
jgi:hypothetical protein